MEFLNERSIPHLHLHEYGIEFLVNKNHTIHHSLLCLRIIDNTIVFFDISLNI